MQRIGPRLRELRSHRLITQKTLGEVAGVSGAQIGRYEAGADDPPFTIAILIMAKLQIWSVDWRQAPSSPLPPCRTRSRLNEDVAAIYWEGDPLKEMLRLAEDIAKDVGHNGHVMATADWIAAVKDRMGIETPSPTERAARHKRMVARIKQHAGHHPGATP